MKQSEGGFLVTKIHHLGGRVFSRKLREHGIEINPGQGRILFALWRDDGISIAELARRTRLSKSTLTEMLDRLEESGHLIRTHSTSDRRMILVELTKKTKEMQGKYSEVSQEMIEVFYKGFHTREVDEFESFLMRVLENLVAFESHSQ
ncbi:MAG: MarR family winged helix-turn-helix transcriptional regulator [Candidatus Thorarchaeota archaeon]|jgi:DNA-binding MarR family transcriptional regulator